MTTNPIALLTELLEGIFSDRNRAHAFVTDPYGTLAEVGLTDADLSDVGVATIANSVCQSMDSMAPAVKEAVASYAAGSPAPAMSPQAPPPPPPAPLPTQRPLEHVVQQLQYLTYVTYEGDEYITHQIEYVTQDITNIDNSTNVKVDGDVKGDLDIDLDVRNVNATGDGAVAAGEHIGAAATGAESLAIGGSSYGNANTGDGAVVGSDISHSAVNTGTNTGVIAGGDVDKAVVGDGNQTVQVSGGLEGVAIGFGEGDTTNTSHVQAWDSSLAVGGGSATTITDNNAEAGSAIAAGNAMGSNVQTTTETNVHTEVHTDLDFTETNTTTVHAEDSVVTTAVDEGDADTDDVDLEV